MVRREKSLTDNGEQTTALELIPQRDYCFARMKKMWPRNRCGAMIFGVDDFPF